MSGITFFGVVMMLVVLVSLVDIIQSTNPSLKKGSSSQQPNIVIFFADNLGHDDIGIFGTSSSPSRTPNIDSVSSVHLHAKSCFVLHVYTHAYSEYI